MGDIWSLIGGWEFGAVVGCFVPSSGDDTDLYLWSFRQFKYNE